MINPIGTAQAYKVLSAPMTQGRKQKYYANLKYGIGSN